MSSSFKLVAIAVLLLAPLDTLARSIYRRQGGDDPQSSLTLDPKVIQPSGELTGLEGGGDPGQVASATSKNNFINFCLTQPVELTDGQQKVQGSCNPIPMGRIAAKDKQPSCKFTFPGNLDESLKENETFTLQLAIRNVETGFFANPAVKYYSAPQTVNDQGIIIGHSHVVIQLIPALQTKDPLNPEDFAFFKGLNAPAQNGVLTAEVTDGLNAGFYRMCSINSSTNHQPVLVAVAQHGSLDDCVYFTVKADGKNRGNGRKDKDKKGKDGKNRNNDRK